MNVENLTLTGTSNINATGNALNNALTGTTGNNVLDGGTGNDTMTGLAGNDTYIVDSATDSVVEALSAGTDTIQSSITILALAANVENLTLTGAGVINGTGNTLDNILIGNSAANTLSGGTGTDTMSGGAGDDIYVVDNILDIVTENSGEGIDLEQSSVTYTLSANVENLTLTGSSAINGTGNSGDNVLIGNSGINSLTGAGGNDTLDGMAGADIMAGGLGDDIYIVDNVADTINENAAEGFDTINSSVTKTISTNVEKLVLTGATAINATGSTADDYLLGNTANNTLTGGGGNDLLNGGGGTGIDTLIGDAGFDVLEGMDGNDVLSDLAGNNLFNGGAGNDTITGNTGNEFFAGGIGNDTINTNIGADIIAFNRGDGQDTVALSTGTDNTITLGGGIWYADLSFTKSTNDLVINLGGSAEKITFTGWYAAPANKSVSNFQVVVEAMTDYNAGSGDILRNKKVENFNFQGLVNAFDAAGAPAAWALTDSLLTTHLLSSSDTAALGGDLAYQYGRNNTLANIGFDPAVAVMSNASFGTSAQALQSLATLQQGIKRLS